MRPKGILVAASYRMARHWVFGVSLLGWLVILPLAVALAMAFRLLGISSWGLALCGLSLLAGIVLMGHQRGGWVAFARDDAPAPAGASPGLGRRLPVRATGSFAIRETRRRYVAASGYYETFETREHVVMVHLKQTRFLLFGQSPKEEVGWWYTFFSPEHVLEIAPVRQVFGGADLPALRLLLRTERDKPAQPLLLAFGSEGEREKVWGDLVGDAVPPPAG
jgi:hypothetical protein